MLRGTEAPGVFWPYQSVLVQHVIKEHIYIKGNAKIDESYALFIKKGCDQSRTIQNNAISKRLDYLTCPFQGRLRNGMRNRYTARDRDHLGVP